MTVRGKERFRLQELASKAGVPGRTLRFYIARGLMSGPDKAGRNAAYGAKHLAQLQRIRELQSQGQTLSEIANATQEVRAPLMVRESPTSYGGNVWRHYEISPDVVLMVRDSAAPWRIRKLVNAVHRANFDEKPENDQSKQEAYPTP